MPPRLKLSRMQRDIMVTLVEAGGETIGTVVATVKPADRTEFDREVDGLVKLGLIRKERNTIYEGQSKTELVLTEAGIEALRK
jgi:DNA-binding MarR family transcriptional regulator